MTKSDIESIVLEIFESLFPKKDSEQIKNLSQGNTDQWDSMTQVNLIAAIEGEFDLVIDIDSASTLQSYEDCVQFVNSQM